jgi:hypothetical protein
VPLQESGSKYPCRSATIANITLSGGASLVIDTNVTLVAGDRILVTGQSNPIENGIYTVITPGTGSNGTWTRATDADGAGDIFGGMLVAVSEGTAGGNSLWMLTTDEPITIGRTSLTFERKDAGAVIGIAPALVNGGFNVWQTGTTVTDQTATNYYAADMWGGNRTGDAVNQDISRIAGRSGGSQYGMKWQRTVSDVATNTMTLYYALLTNASLPYAGQQVTLSFYALKGANYSGGDLTVTLSYGTGMDQREYAFTGRTAVVMETKTLTTSVARYSVTGTVNAACTELGFYLFWTPSGSAGADDSVSVYDFQIDFGATALPYRPVSFITDLSNCEYEYKSSYNYGVAAGTAFTPDTGDGITGRFPTSASATGAGIYYSFNQMRATPTATYYDSAGTAARVSSYTPSTWTAGRTPTGSFVTQNKFFAYYDAANINGITYQVTLNARR